MVVFLIRHHHVTFESSELEKHDCPLPLCCLGLSNGCTVDAIDKKDQEWVIFIKCPDGSVIATPASKEESCIDLHRRVVAAMLATQLPVSPSI